MVKRGDIVQITGEVQEVQHLQGLQHNLRITLPEGGETWVLSDFTQVIYSAPEPVIETQATEESATDNSWRNVPMESHPEPQDAPAIVEGIPVEAVQAEEDLSPIGDIAVEETEAVATSKRGAK